MQGRLKYKIVSCSSQDKDHPVSNLLVKGSTGWQSGRFCSYPQQITLQFYSSVHIKQLQFMSNCRKIARRIDILFYSEKQSVDSRFTKYGYVQLSNNEQTNFEGRQFKSIMVDMHCLYVRFLLHQPHPNRQNFFSQVGLHEINVIGEGMDMLTEPAAAGRYQPAEEIDERTIEDEFIHGKLLILHQLKDGFAKDEKYDEAKRVKEIINNIRSLGYQIRGLEDKKREAVDHEEYDRAQKLKTDIERIRSSAETIFSNYNNPQFRVKTVMREEDQQEESIGSGGLEKSHISMVRNTMPRQADNEFVEEFKRQPTLRINHDDRVLPTHMTKQKTEVRQDDPPPDANDNLPSQPELLSAQLEKQGAILLSLFDQLTVRQYFSKHWQFRLKAIKTFLNELNAPRITKGKDDALLFRQYMNIVNSTLSEKVVQICTHSLQLLQDVLLTNKKVHHEARLHQFQGDADSILLEVIKRMNDNNVKIRGLAEEIFRKMAESGLYGVVVCSNALMRNSVSKLSAKQYKSKLDTLIYLIELYGIGAHAVPLTVVDYAVNYVDYQSAQVRNSAIDLLVQASLRGAEDRIQAAIEKLESNIKDMIQKKMRNAQQAKQAANKVPDKAGGKTSQQPQPVKKPGKK